MMQRCWRPLLLLCLTVGAMNILGKTAEAFNNDLLEVRNYTNQALEVIPYNDNRSNVTILLMWGNLIALNETDQQALASYPALAELHMDCNRVNAVPAKYFSVVPQLRVLSLSGNDIIRLDPEAFFGLDVLTQLDLSRNQLTSLPTQLFRGINRLQVLNLQENPWNCSCPLLTSIQEVTEAKVSIGPLQVTCASPKKQAGYDLLKATVECSATPDSTLDQLSPDNSHQSWGSSTVLQSTPSSSPNHIISNALTDQPPVPGNAWKFTVCVVALALATSMLIVCAIKGPSCYKLFHNYRHRRLGEDEEDEDDNVASTAFTVTGGYLNHQTFTFEQDNGEIEVEEEEEDGYFEDPYIRREE